MVEPKSTANPSETQDRWREFTRKKNKKSVQSVRNVSRQCSPIRGEKFTSRYIHHAKSQRPDEVTETKKPESAPERSQVYK